MIYSQFLFVLVLISCASIAKAEKVHGVSTFNQLKYPSNFTHFDYVNPNAPKGGKITLGAPGNFNSLNPFIVKGNSPAGIGLTYARLLDETRDTPGESYAFVAESMELAEDRTSIIFYLNPNAEFSDGTPITADDVVWSFEILRDKGLPMYRTYYKNVQKVEKIDPHTVKFSFNTTKNRELPGIIGQLPILPKHFYETHSFDSTDMTPPPSSGPYVIEKIEPEKSITYKRVEDWWGESIPTQKGQNNFDVIQYDYYLDNTAQFEAFKVGKIDVRREISAKNWTTGYDFPAMKDGRVIKVELPSKLPSPTYGFFFNTRREIFQDSKVRQALTLCFNFAWINKNLFYNSYKRNESYYPNSDFAAKGKPSNQEEVVLKKSLEQFPEEKEVLLKALTEAFALPFVKSESEFRNYLLQAANLLKEAGWVLDKGILKNAKNGKPFEFEIIIADKTIEKIVLHFRESLEKIGIILKVRFLDTAAYQYRMEHLDYDMILGVIGQSASLGNEQRDYFGSERADAIGTYNYAGIKNNTVDYLIEELIKSETYNDLCAHARALDSVLLWNFYMIPAWHKGTSQVAYWNKFGIPSVTAEYQPFDITTWWYDAEKVAKLEAIKNKNSEPFFTNGWEKIKSFFGRL